MRSFELTRQHSRRLEKQLKTTRDTRVYRRTLALLEIAGGRTVSEVATMLRMTRQAVYRWVAIYAESQDPGALADRERRGRRSFWADEAAEDTLRVALEHSPNDWGYKAVNWTVPLLSTHVGAVLGRTPSYRQVQDKLHELNYVWKRPRHTLEDAKSRRVRRRLRAIRKQVRGLPENTAKVFADETDILLFPPLRAGWFLRGKPAEVSVSGDNAKRTVFGTIDVETGRRAMSASERGCAADFSVILRLIRREYEKGKVALLLDGASRHSAQESRALAADLEIKLIWLPPRCTNINPMDRLWRWGKDKICANKQYLSIEYQAERFIECLLGLSPEEALRTAGLRSGKFWLFR